MTHDRQRLRHPFADMARVPGRELVLVRSLVGHGLRISPPFVISEQEIDLLAERLGGVREAQWSASGVPA
jgi:acetylornithine/succinyldiaminopimelate/putrescine aminotransferase